MTCTCNTSHVCGLLAWLSFCKQFDESCKKNFDYLYNCDRIEVLA